MTILLLDTHAYVWALTEPARLSRRARTAIEASSNAVLVSAATAWEMAIKHRAGKWPEAEILLAQHDDLTSRLARRRSTSPPQTRSARGASTGTMLIRSTGCLPPSHYSTEPRW